MKNAIIIGAGPAGLTAGVELLRRSGDYSVTILEKSENIGGISRTVQCHGNYMDIGGHRFFSKSEKVVKWWENIMPQGNMLTRERVSRIYYNKRFFDYPVTLSLKTLHSMGIKNVFLAGMYYLFSCFFKRKENSLEDFYINRFGKHLYEMFFKNYTEKVWGIPPCELSADWGAQRVRGLSLGGALSDALRKSLGRKNKDNTETSLIEEFMYPKHGPGELWENAAKCFTSLGGRILRGCDVTRLCPGEDGYVKYICNNAEETLPCDIVISSMPICTLAEALPNIPQDIAKIGKELPYRDFVTVGLLLEKKKRSFPDCWIYVQDKDIGFGRIQIFNNWSPYLVADSENTLWLGLEYFLPQGEAQKLSDEEWKKRAADDLVCAGFAEKNEKILLSHTERAEKAYPTYAGSYGRLPLLREYLDTIDGLYCIGRNGQHRYNNMDHSMLTAFEAVENILSGRKSKDNIWGVNREKKYNC